VLCGCRRLQVQLLDDQSALLGSLEPLVPSSGGALAKPRQVMSYCTRFDGGYTDAKGRQQVVSVGSKYGFNVLLHGPVSLTDAAREISPRVDEVRSTRSSYTASTVCDTVCKPAHLAATYSIFIGAAGLQQAHNPPGCGLFSSATRSPTPLWPKGQQKP